MPALSTLQSPYRELVKFLVGLSKSHKHPGVIGPQFVGLLVVVEAVEVHLEDLVRLTEAVPSAVVATVDL